MNKKILVALSFFCFFQFFSFSLENKDEFGIQSFSLKNGIPLYVKQDSNSELTSLLVVVKGGVFYLTPELSGLESAVFSLMQTGSKKYSPEAIKDFEFSTHTSFDSYSIQDGSVFSVTSISKYFDKSYDVFEDCFFNPLFSQKEYDLLKKDLALQVQGVLNEPSSLLSFYLYDILYSEHPYKARTFVTPESIENITLSAIKNHYQSLLDSRRISIVAAGNVDLQKLTEFLNRSFGSIKKGKDTLRSMEVPSLNISGVPVVFSHESASGTGFITRVFKTPSVTSEYYAAARLTAKIYSDILYEVVREKYGACYTPFSDITSSASPFGMDYLYRVSNLRDFGKYMEEAKDIMRKGQTISGIDKNGNFTTEPLANRLEGYKNAYINEKYSSQQTVYGVAARIASSILQFGDYYSAELLTKNAKEVSVQDIEYVFNTYWDNSSSRWFAVTGPEDEDSLFKVLEVINE